LATWIVFSFRRRVVDRADSTASKRVEVKGAPAVRLFTLPWCSCLESAHERKPRGIRLDPSLSHYCHFALSLATSRTVTARTLKFNHTIFTRVYCSIHIQLASTSANNTKRMPLKRMLILVSVRQVNPQSAISTNMDTVSHIDSYTLHQDALFLAV